jgi:hypothetical protein
MPRYGAAAGRGDGDSQRHSPHGGQSANGETASVLPGKATTVPCRDMKNPNDLARLRGARTFRKLNIGRCEGRKPFGYLPGVEATLARMIALRAANLNGAKQSNP